MSFPFRRLLLILLSLSLIACGGRIPLARRAPTPEPGQFNLLEEIAPENASELVETITLSAPDAGIVADLAFIAETDELLAAYADESALRRWSLADGALVSTFDVHPIVLGATAFDGAGDSLATAGGREWMAHRFDDDYLGFRVWDTHTGELILRAGQNRPSSDAMGGISILIDIALSPNGDWILASVASAMEYVDNYKLFFQVEVPTGRIGDTLVWLDRVAEEDDFDTLAFDQQGQYFAAADESGQVAIYPVNPPEYPDKPAWVVEAAGQLGDRPLALAFDGRRRWLAVVRDREAIVWDLQSNGYPRQLETHLGDEPGTTASLAFSPSGELLAIGSANGWQMWDLVGGKVVAELEGVEVYALAFSRDGRLFAWGDANGLVHLWAVA